MLQCEAAAMGGSGAALRLRLLYRMLRAGELLALVAFVSWSSAHVPSAVAAAMRLAGSLLLNARFVFVLGNAIVLLLFALSRHDDLSTDERQPAAASTTAVAAANPAPQQPASSSSDHHLPVGSAASTSSFPSLYTTSTTTTTLPASSTTMGGGAAADPLAPRADPLAPRAARDETRRVPVPAAEPDPDDKIIKPPGTQQPAVRVTKARAPRRSRSEKVVRRAASPELRRCESENGRGGRRRSSVTARDAEACWGREDADEFRRQVEAFIARQTRFHREESMSMSVAGPGGQHCEAAPAFTGALAVVE